MKKWKKRKRMTNKKGEKAYLRSKIKIPMEITKLYPENGKILLTGGGKEFIERLGIDAIKKAILSVMLGENLRSQTEPLTRQRISQVAGAMISMLTSGYLNIENFSQKISTLSAEYLKTAKKKNNSSIWPYQWLIGLTGKSVDNVLRGDKSNLDNYIKDFEAALKLASEFCLADFGEIEMALNKISKDEKKEVPLNWNEIMRLTSVIGTLTLTIRGSDKSMYGKLFERLILGSLLTILGFKRIKRQTAEKAEKIFWLSDSTDTRESDATVILSPGNVIRFDIGFIGKGNPEISKDKLSRFAREIEMNGQKSSSTTIIIIDTLPKNSKSTEEDIKKTGSMIIQMSMAHWIAELCNNLYTRFGFKHPLQKLADKELENYLSKALVSIPVQEFLAEINIEQLEAQAIAEEKALAEEIEEE
jgi:hypothetical protein